ncbi:hypothetical protein ACFXKG_07105 [Streptomyces sp. NPDC059255]|uniref:hypothetical protein n=1 Tax=Streptomyces sp. NPDC059255 TaxID=3346793 RepID=UPI00369F1474
MARFVRPTVARLWAGLFVVFTLAICTTGIARPAAAAAPTDMAPMNMPATAWSVGPIDGQSAEPGCPMGDMECAPQAQHRPSPAPLPLTDSVRATVVDRVAAGVHVERAPPGPGSREGPDLDRLCVSRT